MEDWKNWEAATKWEAEWHGDCVTASFGEEYKQLAYAKRMGLKTFHDGRSPFVFDLGGRSVIDLGGGSCSLLLKCVNRGRSIVVDPCDYPGWTVQRYTASGIILSKMKAEEVVPENCGTFDEVWMYNLLQHVEDPARICANARRLGKIVRVFDWLHVKVGPGHIHELNEAQMNLWLGGMGKVEKMNENTAAGLCYYGIFVGEAK